MKKLLLSMLIVLLNLSAFAQQKVSEYSMEYFTSDQVFDIEATEPKNGNFTYYIYAKSLESSNNKIGFYFDSDELDKFTTPLRHIGEKLEEWSATARDNNVKDFDKDFDAKFKSVKVFFRYGKKWCFTSVKFKPYFKVTKDGECLAVFRTGRLTASSNQFMHHDGFMMAFSSKDEIENFIKALDPEPILKKEPSNAERDALFK